MEEASLQKRVYDIVRAYVFRKTSSRSGIKWEDFKDKKNEKGQVEIPLRYRQAREKICSSAFLAVRGRRSREDFVSYFTDSICSVPQYLPEGEYRLVAEALYSDRWEEIKSLTMLALSGLSKI